MIYESRVTTNGDLRYQVQVRQCRDGVVEQRHIWFRTQTGEHDPPQIDEWICAPTRNLELWARGLTPNPEYKDEISEAIAALEEIASGHNDARRRALEALQTLRRQAA